MNSAISSHNSYVTPFNDSHKFIASTQSTTKYSIATLVSPTRAATANGYSKAAVNTTVGGIKVFNFKE